MYLFDHKTKVKSAFAETPRRVRAIEIPVFHFLFSIVGIVGCFEKFSFDGKFNQGVFALIDAKCAEY